MDALKHQVEEYTLQIARIQDILGQKELEKEELMLQYKTLTQKTEELENNLLRNTDESAHTQQELRARRRLSDDAWRRTHRCARDDFARTERGRF